MGTELAPTPAAPFPQLHTSRHLWAGLDGEGESPVFWPKGRRVGGGCWRPAPPRGTGAEPRWSAGSQ